MARKYKMGAGTGDDDGTSVLVLLPMMARRK